MKKKYSKLSESQRTALQAQGCTSDSWDSIEVGEGFRTDFVRDAHFGGKVRLGANGTPVELPGGVVRRSGIYRAALHDCTVGDGVLIANVGRYMARYDVEDGAVIENVGQIICDGRSSFGNGVEVATINEAGGREVPIYDGLTAQIAYVLAMYRHRTRTVERLRGLIARYAESRTASRGAIGRGSSVVNTLSLLNVSVGEGASIDGAASLCNGTLNSTFESPSRIGSGVTASDFVVACSATVDTGSMLRRCFVGEGVVIENGFSAENSLFFANSHLNHGEACAVFAGPYTVSHHRSTLLIAGYFSFFNAGSGANQSNHMYKSGPVHQGVHLRGCKFGSDAYVLLPASTGAFTIVTGRHYNHHDTERMPFSYLVEEAGDSVLLPAVNIRSCGTARDIDKWPRRDRRRGVAHDLIRYDMMNPYTAGRVLDAIGECEALIGRHPTAEAVTWNRVKIKTPSLRKGLVLYRQALRSYLAGLLGEGMADARPDASLRQWVDLAGLIAPRSRVEALLDRIDRGEIDDLNRLEEAFREIDRRYEADARRWALYALSVLLGKPEESIGSDDIGELVRQGADDRRALEAAVGQDALRDRAPVMATASMRPNSARPISVPSGASGSRSQVFVPTGTASG